MPKVPLSTITSGYGTVDALNANFNAIEDAFDNTLSRDGETPNQMSANLDMNGNALLNVGTINGAPITALNDISGYVNTALAAATSASASATSAADTYDQFDDRYLGSKTSNPTVDNDGNALQVGAEYWNSVSNERRTWTGSAWVSSITVVPDNSVTTAKLADASVTTAKLAPVIAPVVSSLNGGQLAGMRNRIINGAMAIDQRNNGALVSITTGSALAYTVDRWFVWVTGTGNIAGVQRASGTSPNEFLLQIGNGGSGKTVRVAQRIEASNSQDLAGTVATLSADLARTPTSGTLVTWTASYANTINSFGTVAAPTKTQIATGNFTISNTVTRYSTQISIPSAAITGIEIEFSWQTSSTVSDNVIGRVQLEPGSVATPFEHRPIGTELALCQRYYQVHTIGELAGYTLVANQRISALTLFPVAMRTTPTRTVVTAGTSNNVRAPDTTYSGLISGLTTTSATCSLESAATGYTTLTNRTESLTAEL